MISAIIPIKENSQRVPQKNFRIFCGQPLFSYIISTLLSIEIIDKIIINTDSKNIEKMICNKFNLNKIVIYHRPKHLCGDDISVNLLIEDTLNHFQGNHFIQTHVTNPCITAHTISDAINKYFSSLQLNDSCISVNKFYSRFYNSEFMPINHHINELKQTQDLPPIYEDNSCFYIFSRNVINKFKRRIGEHPLLYSIPRLESVDIDTEDDFNIAELIYKFLITKK